MLLVNEGNLQLKKASDQYLGWVVSGLNVNDVFFAVLPLYFEFTDNGELKEKICGHGIQGEFFSCSFLDCFALLSTWFLGWGFAQVK